jgi:cell division protein FtsW
MMSESTLTNKLLNALYGDRVIWTVMVILGLFSLLAVYSATGTLAYKESGGNTESFLIKHGLILALGLLVTYIVHLLHYMTFSKSAPLLLLVSIPLLIYTILFGAEYNDARRWISLPWVGVTFQSSDFAKLALIIYVAKAISAKQDIIKDFNSAFIPIILPIIIVCGLIAPADLSSALLLFFTAFLMMFVGRVSSKYLILLLMLGVVMFSFLIILGQFFPEAIRLETWVSRMNEFISNPEGGYQVRQSKIAIASGEWIGMGPGNSIQRNYLPAPYSDFIYAIICEEYGLMGGISVILLYLILFIRVTRLVTKSPKAFGAMLAFGLAMSMIVQAFANIAVSVHLVPVTGVTLPLISMGGTSVLFTSISFGIILSVSKFIESLKTVQGYAKNQ